MEEYPQPLTITMEENLKLESSVNEEETSFSERDRLVHIIRQWVQNDHDMNLLKQELAKRREKQKKLTGTLVEIMRENEMEEADIMYVQETKKKSISKKSLIPILFRFYKGDTAKAAELSQYIYDNRETVVQEKIKPKKPEKK